MTEFSPAELASIQALEKIRDCIDNNQCFRLEAGAGAGKTYSLIESIKYLVDKRAVDLMRREQKIACITYTNVAKKEIKDRTDHHPVIFADTIHAFCWSVLKDFQVKLRELVAGLSDKWTERVKDFGGITTQLVKYELGFPSINEREVSLHHDDVVALMARMLLYPKFQSLLKSKYPIVFIDEYQDTDIDLAKSIVSNLIDNMSGMLVGLFGDHWQKIYGSSACGLILSKMDKIVEIGKEANFRSDKNIVHCLNRFRPDLPQAESDPESTGVIKVFHSNSWVGVRRDARGGGHWTGDLPAKNAKDYIDKIKELMVAEGWDMSSKHTKILFLTNNLIATEQNFKNLADCFQYTDDYLKKADKYIQFFFDVIEPVASAYQRREYGEVLQIVRKNRPELQRQEDKKVWSGNLKRLIDSRNDSTIGGVLDLLDETKTPRFSPRVEHSEENFKLLRGRADEDLEPVDERILEKLKKMRGVNYREVINLGQYIDEKTPFSTKHGVKGAEFDNVIVVCGRGWNHYNWDQMLEWMRDGCPQERLDTYERNRNLFYVSCSRAKHNLTLLFTQEISQKSIAVIEQIFGKGNMVGDPFN